MTSTPYAQYMCHKRKSHRVSLQPKCVNTFDKNRGDIHAASGVSYELSIGSRVLAEEAFGENEVLESARVSVELGKLHHRNMVQLPVFFGDPADFKGLLSLDG